MNLQWLNRSGNDKIIVIFGGWAIGAEPFAHLKGDYDLLFIDGCETLDADLPDLSAYTKRILLAFSFGVANYAHWQQDRNDIFHTKIAVNGTLSPVDRAKGIPPIVMQKTIDHLSQQSFQQFLTRCYGATQPVTDIDVAAMRAELQAVQNRGAAPNCEFDLVWVANKDKIFPPQNQLRAWGEREEVIKQIDAPHVPFACWQTWDEVLGVR